MMYGRLSTIGLMLLGIAAYGASQANAGPVPNWDQKLNAPARFVVLTDWNNEAVLDQETGLVWEKTPDKDPSNWFEASIKCVNKKVGGRMGWRLPAIQELASLVDPTVKGAPKLPGGHPFSDVQYNQSGTDDARKFTVGADYWSATNVPAEKWYFIYTRANMWYMDFSSGTPAYSFGYMDNTYRHVWCVRGGQGVNYLQGGS